MLFCLIILSRLDPSTTYNTLFKFNPEFTYLYFPYTSVKYDENYVFECTSGIFQDFWKGVDASLTNVASSSVFGGAIFDELPNPHSLHVVCALYIVIIICLKSYTPQRWARCYDVYVFTFHLKRHAYWHSLLIYYLYHSIFITFKVVAFFLYIITYFINNLHTLVMQNLVVVYLL